MAPIRLRHPKGVTTLQIPLEDENYTVQSLQQQIYVASDILPSRQNLKCGYPPQTLTLIPELPLSSLGLQSGEQLIVSENPGPASAPSYPEPALVQQTQAPATGAAGADGPIHVEINGGFLVHRVVPDDNSCLFASVALIFEQSTDKASKLRQIVAEGIRRDPETYSEAILGLPQEKYITTILKPSTWGGAIELAILATHYGTEIASIDVETGRIDRFPPKGASAGNRCLLIYSGIHYDAVTLSPMLDAPDEWHQTVFPVSNSSAEEDDILLALKQLADQLRARKAFTNTSTFDLKCEECGKGLKGEKEARAHAESTGHVRFGEY